MHNKPLASRSGCRQISHSSSSVNVLQRWQWWICSMALCSTLLKSIAPLRLRSKRWNAIRWALLLPTPGRQVNAWINSFSNGLNFIQTTYHVKSVTKQLRMLLTKSACCTLSIKVCYRLVWLNYFFFWLCCLSNQFFMHFIEFNHIRISAENTFKFLVGKYNGVVVFKSDRLFLRNQP